MKFDILFLTLLALICNGTAFRITFYRYFVQI